MPWDIPTHPARYDAAIALFRDDLGLDVEEFRDVVRAARRRGFKVAGVADLDLVTDVWAQLETAEAEGTPFEEFKAAIAERLFDAWGSEKPWRVENIFRTNLQQGYSYGRYGAQLAAIEDRPFWRYSAILDGESECEFGCADRHGTVLPADDPWWASNYPPLHFQ